MNVYLRVLQYYKPFIPLTVFGLFISLLGIGINLLKPWPLKVIIDSVLPLVQMAQKHGAGMEGIHLYDIRYQGSFGKDFSIFPADISLNFYQMVFFICAALVVIFFVSGILNFVSNYILVKIGLKALLKIRTELYACLQSLPLKFHDQRRSGDSTFRVAYDSQAIQSIFNKGFTGVFASVFTLIGTFAVMWNMNVKMTLLSLVILPLVVGTIYFFADRIRRESTSVQEEESDVFSTVNEGMGNIRVTHAFGREDHEVSAFQKQAMESLQANLNLTWTNVLSALVIGTVMALGTALMIYFGTLEVAEGKITLGDLTVFLAYLAMLYQPLEALSYTAWALEGAAAGAQRCFEVLDQENETKDSPGARPISNVKGDIEIRDVHFSYTPEKPILRGISLKVPHGKTVAFIGGTGAGKSTLMSLVPRFYDPVKGDVFVDGVNLKEITKRSLRDHISMVLQDTVLLNATIRENIAYGKLNASEAEIVEAAKAAQAHEFIQGQPQGYNTPVGERGIRLSVGQRQRIGIARAFLKNSPILLLDEPTSALDPQTESEIMESIERLMQGRTTLIITHRILTIHNVDTIHVLEHGKIVQSGNGPELLARDGLYKSLYEAQGKRGGSQT